MHFSRMRTVRCSGRLGGGVCLEGCLPRGCLPRGMSAWWGVCSRWCRPQPGPRGRHSPCGQNDRRLWKHYLSATTVVDGKYEVVARSQQSKFELRTLEARSSASALIAAACWMRASASTVTLVSCSVSVNTFIVSVFKFSALPKFILYTSF